MQHKETEKELPRRRASPTRLVSEDLTTVALGWAQAVGAASTTKHAVVAVEPPMLRVATRSAPST